MECKDCHMYNWGCSGTLGTECPLEQQRVFVVQELIYADGYFGDIFTPTKIFNQKERAQKYVNNRGKSKFKIMEMPVIA